MRKDRTKGLKRAIGFAVTPAKSLSGKTAVLLELFPEVGTNIPEKDRQEASRAQAVRFLLEAHIAQDLMAAIQTELAAAQSLPHEQKSRH